MWKEKTEDGSGCDIIDRTTLISRVDDLVKPVVSAVPAADSYTDTYTYLRRLVEQVQGRLHVLEDRNNAPLLTRAVNCPNCGGTTEMDVNNHILRCKYCRSVIFVGTQHTNG